MKMIKRIGYLSIVCFFMLSLIETVNARQIEEHVSDRGDFVPGRVIVGMNSSHTVSRSELNHSLFSEVNIENVEVLVNGNTNIRSAKDAIGQILLLELVEEDEQSVLDAIDLLEKHPDVDYAEPDHIFYLDDLLVQDDWIGNDRQSALNRNAIFIPDNPQWNMVRIGATEAWKTTTGSSTITVGSIDTGIDHTHLNLALNVDPSQGYDFVYDTPNAMDIHGHGTRIAGILGAVGSNNRNVIGVAPEVTQIPLKVYNSNGNGVYSAVVKAVDYAREINLDLINMQVAGQVGNFINSYQALENAMRAFNGLIITAAGNFSSDGDIDLVWPGSFDLPNNITVGNSNQSDSRTPSSNFGQSTVHLFAPGVNLVTTGIGNIFQTYSDGGTSSATPHVVGAAVLALSVNPYLTPVQLKDAILNTVDPIPALTSLSVTGGRLNAEKLVDEVNLINNFEFSFNHGNQTASVTGYTGRWTDIIIPAIVSNNGIDYTVTAIGERAFRDKGLTSIKLPASITHIPDYAFVNNSLGNIELTNLTITFGIDPFRFNELRYITVPEGSATLMKDILDTRVMGSDNHGAILREGTIPKYQWDANTSQWLQYEEEYTFHDIFPDGILALRVAQAMRGEEATIEEIVTIEELNDFTNNGEILNLGLSSIRNIEGLQHLKSITRLNLNSIRSRDLSPLSELISLIELRLALTGGIEDLSIFTSLTQLQILNLDNAGISNIEQLSELTQLQTLVLSRNRITDLAPLSELTLLRELNLNYNGIMDPWDNEVSGGIEDLTPLSHLTSLTHLYIATSRISDLTPLSNLTSLTTLDVGTNRITDLTPINHLSSLRILNAMNQWIILDTITFGDFTEGIFIRDWNGSTPTITFESSGGSYDAESGTIFWSEPGANSLSWRGSLISGTIRQTVQ